MLTGVGISPSSLMSRCGVAGKGAGPGVPAAGRASTALSAGEDSCCWPPCNGEPTRGGMLGTVGDTP